MRDGPAFDQSAGALAGWKLVPVIGYIPEPRLAHNCPCSDSHQVFGRVLGGTTVPPGLISTPRAGVHLTVSGLPLPILMSCPPTVSQCSILHSCLGAFQWQHTLSIPQCYSPPVSDPFLLVSMLVSGSVLRASHCYPPPSSAAQLSVPQCCPPSCLICLFLSQCCPQSTIIVCSVLRASLLSTVNASPLCVSALSTVRFMPQCYPPVSADKLCAPLTAVHRQCLLRFFAVHRQRLLLIHAWLLSIVSFFLISSFCIRPCSAMTVSIVS